MTLKRPLRKRNPPLPSCRRIAPPGLLGCGQASPVCASLQYPRVTCGVDRLVQCLPASNTPTSPAVWTGLSSVCQPPIPPRHLRCGQACPVSASLQYPHVTCGVDRPLQCVPASNTPTSPAVWTGLSSVCQPPIPPRHLRCGQASPVCASLQYPRVTCGVDRSIQCVPASNTPTSPAVWTGLSSVCQPPIPPRHLRCGQASPVSASLQYPRVTCGVDRPLQCVPASNTPASPAVWTGLSSVCQPPIPPRHLRCGQACPVSASLQYPRVTCGVDRPLQCVPASNTPASPAVWTGLSSVCQPPIPPHHLLCGQASPVSASLQYHCITCGADRPLQCVPASNTPASPAVWTGLSSVCQPPIPPCLLQYGWACPVSASLQYSLVLQRGLRDKV
nr:uncharacterized protein LOC112206645 [Pan troglodytes]